MGRARLVGLAVAILALPGCATVALPEPGLSDAERAEVVRQLSDSWWQGTGLPDELRPPDPQVELISVVDWAVRYEECMTDAGFDMNGPELAADGRIADEYVIADFVCGIRFMVKDEESGQLNRAQRDYWYAYYEQWLIPCLIQHEIAITDAPTRDEFDEGLGWWNPYFSVDESDRKRVDTQLREDCSPVPPGVEDPGYYGLY